MNEESVEAELESLKFNMRQTQQRVRVLEEMIDTRDSWWWKRLKWRVWDGYPPWFRVGPSRRGR